MKYELSLLLRAINEQISIEEQFTVHPLNGMLIYEFKIPWRDFKIKIPRIEALRKLFAYIISNIVRFGEIITFCEVKPVSSEGKERTCHVYD